jgi:glycosyltransferase involved in cell wall biosynthesis
MNICIRGPLLSISGYGNHARQVFRWLSEKPNVNITSQILPWGITPWHINPSALGGLAGKVMESSAVAKDSGYDISFQIQLPNEWNPNLARYNVGVTAAVETDICNPAWVDACNTMDLIVVPSEHTKKTIVRSGNLIKPIVVVPESFPDEISSPDVKPFNLNVKTSFNFLLFGQLTGINAFHDRKNTYHAIKWLSEEFANDSDVGIVIKTNHGRNTTIDRKMVRQIFENVVSGIGDHPPIYLLHGAMTELEVAGLYTNPKIKALVAPTRGEGFGLPLLEAASSGLPVLATKWSGHCDFLNQGKWIKFNHKLVAVPQGRVDGQIFIEGSRWAEVNETDFKKKVRKFKNKPEVPQEWASDLRKSLSQSHSFKAIAEAWDSVMRDYTT